MLDSRVTATTSSRIFLNMLAEVDIAESEALETFQSLLSLMQSKYAQRLLKLKVDEIEVKVRIRGADGKVTPIRLIASSMEGKWLKADGYVEFPDPVTGVTSQFCPIGSPDPDNAMCYLSPYPTSNKLAMKRAAVRRISSTYAYDFLGLMEVTLVQRWGEFLQEMKDLPSATITSMPSEVFDATELVLDEEGVLRTDLNRPVGTNDIGMVAWHTSMKTPEYPEGREVVVISNDVTVQSGSFGVKEDDFFQAATNYARARGLPRVYIACNSGARIGLVESLKPLFKVAWKDENNPGVGFDYLYLSEEDYVSLPEGSVNARKVDAPGGTRYALDDIIGKIHGIGVENLRGSGTIAGETGKSRSVQSPHPAGDSQCNGCVLSCATARAYDEIFTLSYITGRTVGIGAYLVRLGQRTIQMQVGLMPTTSPSPG